MFNHRGADETASIINTINALHALAFTSAFTDELSNLFPGSQYSILSILYNNSVDTIYLDQAPLYASMHTHFNTDLYQPGLLPSFTNIDYEDQQQTLLNQIIINNILYTKLQTIEECRSRNAIDIQRITDISKVSEKNQEFYQEEHHKLVHADMIEVDARYLKGIELSVKLDALYAEHSATKATFWNTIPPNC